MKSEEFWGLNSKKKTLYLCNSVFQKINIK